MNGLIYFLAILGIGFVIQITAKLLLAIFWTKPKLSNPYIDLHKIKDRNDKNYDAYLKWLDQKGYGVPIPKLKTPEEKKVEEKFKELL